MRRIRSRSLVCLFIFGLALLPNAMRGGELAQSRPKPQAQTSTTPPPPPPPPPSCTNFVGFWTNQLGSTMAISKVDSTSGLVTGCYCSPSGTTGTWFPLTGWVNSLAPNPPQNNVVVISWTVRWGSYGSITSWSGTCGSSGTINAPWYLVRPNSSFAWDHRLADTDTFSPATASTCGPPSC
jgi:Avidin family